MKSGILTVRLTVRGAGGVVSQKLLKIFQKKVTTNECRQIEVPVCTKEPSTVSKEVCRDIPREVISDDSQDDRVFIAS